MGAGGGVAMIPHAMVSSMSAVDLEAPQRYAGAERCAGVLVSPAPESVSQLEGLIEKYFSQTFCAAFLDVVAIG